MNMNVWDHIQQLAQRHTPGTDIRTTLLGRVGIRTLKDGQLQGEIPDDLQSKANQRGMVIINADYKDDSYTLRRVGPSQSVQIETTGYRTASNKTSNKQKARY